MNNTGPGLWTVEVFISPGTQVLQRMSAAIEADPTYDAALLAADRVDFAAINPRDLTLEVPSQSKFQQNYIDTDKDAAPPVGNNGACLSLEKFGPPMPLCPDLVAVAAGGAGGTQPIQRSRSIAVQRGMRVLRRMVLRSFFTRWSGITFLYVRAGNLPDRHTRPLAAPIPKFNFRCSKAYGLLRGKLHWILFWLQFFRLTQRAQRLLAERLWLWCHNHCQFTSRQTNDTMSTWLSLLFDLFTWLMAYLMAWGTRWIYDRLFQILFAFVCPAVYSENISSLDFIVLYSQYLTSCGSWLIDIVLGVFCISTMLRSVFLFGRHWAADHLLLPPDRPPLGAVSFPPMITSYWSTSCMCMALNLVALSSSIYLVMCGGANAIASLFEVGSTFLFLPFVVAGLLSCCRLLLLVCFKWLASDGQVIMELYPVLGMILLPVNRYDCSASLILSQALVLDYIPQFPSRSLHLELPYPISVAGRKSAACCIGEGPLHYFRMTCWMHQLRTFAPAKPVVHRSRRLQLTLRLTDGSHKILLGLTLASSAAELYRCVEKRLGLNKYAFSLVCRNRILSGTEASLETIIPTLTETLMIVSILNGAGRGTPNKDRAKRQNLSTSEGAQQSSIRSRYSLRARPSREIRVHPPVRDPIYELGVVSSAVRADLEELVQRCNASEERQQLCAQIRGTSARCLRVTQEPGKGQGVQVLAPIMAGTELCYYSGLILDSDSGSNYCLALLDEEISERRKDRPNRYTIYLDGDAGTTAHSQGVASMQMVNHKCEENSNCYVEHIMFCDDGTGLGILVLKAKRDITLEELKKGPVFLSFAYRGTFFRPAIPGELTPSGYRRICCGCGNKGVCPRNLVRFERAVADGVPVAQLASLLVPAAEHQSQVLSLHIDIEPTKDTDEDTEFRLWKQAEADLRRLNRADARLSRALDSVRAKRGAASNCLEKIEVLQHHKTPGADGKSEQSCTTTLQTLLDEDGCLDQLRQDLRNSLLDVQVNTTTSSPVCLSPLIAVTPRRDSGGFVNGGIPTNPPVIQSGTDESWMQCRTQPELGSNAETKGEYPIECTFGALCGQSMEGADAQRAVLPAVSDDLGTRLHLHLLNASLRFALEGMDVNSQPYAIISGLATLSWRGRSYNVLVNDEVRAARGNGACGLLCILDVCRAAAMDQQFCNRIKEHVELKGSFYEKWNMLVALSGDEGAEGLRVMIYCHAIRHKERFSTLFPRSPRLSEAETDTLLRFEHQNGFRFDVETPLCPVRLAAYRFLCLSEHLTESFLAVFFDWMENKVALMPLLQVPSEGADGPTFIHISELNFITDEAVLLFKILNIEKHNGLRIGLNHFDRVGGQQPMTFLEDLPAAGSTSSADQRRSCSFLDARADLMRNSLRSFFARYAVVQAAWQVDKRSSVGSESMEVSPEDAGPNLRIKNASAVIDDGVDGAPIGVAKQVISDQLSATGGGLKVDDLLHAPEAVGDSTAAQGASILTVEITRSEGLVPSEPTSCMRDHSSISFERAVHLLRSFDISLDWGPSQSLTRAERISRRKQVGQVPPGWEWVENILQIYPALADVKPAPHPLLRPLGNSEAGRDVKVPKANVPTSKTTNLTSRTCSRRSSKAVCSSSQKLANALSGQRRRGNHKSLCQPTSSRSERTLADFWPSNIRQPAAPGSIVSTSQATNPTRTASSAIPTPTPVCSQKDCSERVPVSCSATADSKLMCVMTTNVADVTKQENVELQLSPGTSFVCRPSLQETLPPRRRIPGLKPWVPGTTGLYPRPIGAAPSHIRPRSFPVWNIQVPGKGWQEAMFLVADKIAPSAFYVAADIWANKKRSGWGLVKIYGAFADVFSFVEHLMVPSPTRCFYELIREGRPCKAYFDLEADGGLLTVEQGSHLCNRVIFEWSELVKARWPTAVVDCPKCLEPIVLDGSRMTDKGWKVSFHLVYPYLTFPCNNTLLKDAATALSNLSSLCFCDGDGTTCRFVDTAVYTRNRQFRLPLNHKLSDATCSVLRLPGCPTASTFRLACVTCLEQEAWRVPESTSPPLPTTSLAVRTISGAGYATRTSFSVPNEVRTAESGILSSLFALLRNAGQPDGRLQAKEGDACTFQWTTFSPLPCCVAQLWRPTNPSHDTNGAYVTYDSSHAVFLKCLHPQCLRFGGRGEFLVYLAPVSSTTTTENDTAPMSAFQRG